MERNFMNADPELLTTACTRGSVTEAVTLIRPQVAPLESKSAAT